ncbi:SPFH domain-containing protein [Jatrophihabitans endophyticus]|uniref:SPFH domain-containing protein n=1 Tax=Jatrophihabitans endophyticus TaxID=1206085 RepID=UPI0019DC0EB1|nr:SPFH domain-containing protein [Jatrophihabitans endophyticus]MBE7186711.1 SPFH domain-containing protein [Jatrophihabitans endophyticus]
MGLMDRVKGQFIDIVEFLDNGRDTLVWRFPRQGNEIKMGAQLVVREGQQAVFVNEGTIADVYAPGMYTLETQNMPVLSDLKGWKYGFNSPFKAEVYFVSTRLFTDLKWGTQHPITVRDKEFGMVRLRAFGGYAIQATDPAKLLRQLVGTDPDFRTEEVSDFLRQTIVGQVASALANANLPMLDLASHQDTIAQTLVGTLTQNLSDMGIAVPRFIIENISLPPEVEEMLDKRTSMGVLGDLDQYTKFQTAQAITEAASNPNAGNSALGLGVGVALGQQVAGVMTGAAAAPQQAAPQQQPAPQAAAAAPPPLPTPPAPYYLAIGGQQVGPVPFDQLAARVASGELTAQTLVWQQGMPEWTPAANVGPVSGLLASAPPPLPPQQ